MDNYKISTLHEELKSTSHLQTILSIYRELADYGCVYSQFKAGELCYSCTVQSGYYPEALKWFKKASKNYHVGATYMLGEMYYFGDGVEKDQEQAFVYYLFAAKQGNAKAQWRLTEIYLDRKNGNVNSERAEYWCREAAKRKHKNALNLVESYTT